MARIVPLSQVQSDSLGTFSTVVEHKGWYIGLGIVNRHSPTQSIELMGNGHNSGGDLEEFLDNHNELPLSNRRSVDVINARMTGTKASCLKRIDCELEAAQWNAAATLLEKLAIVARSNAIQAKTGKPYGTQRA